MPANNAGVILLNGFCLVNYFLYIYIYMYVYICLKHDLTYTRNLFAQCHWVIGKQLMNYVVYGLRQ